MTPVTAFYDGLDGTKDDIARMIFKKHGGESVDTGYDFTTRERSIMLRCNPSRLRSRKR